jgi:hypothetical protein
VCINKRRWKGGEEKRGEERRGGEGRGGEGSGKRNLFAEVLTELY